MRSWWKYTATDWLRRERENVEIWLSWRMPRRLAKWVYIRVVSESGMADFGPSREVITTLKKFAP